MNFFELMYNVVCNVQLGEYYPIVFSCSLTVVVGLLLVFATVFKQIRKFSKIIVLPPLFLVTSLVFVKVLCDLTYGNQINVCFSICSVVIFAFALIECVILFSLKPIENDLIIAEKQLIDQLLKENEEQPNPILENYFSNTPFRRVEYLNTKKGFCENGFSDFNLNPSYVEKCITELLEKPLNNEDRLTIEQIDYSVKKYKLKNLSDYERYDFSTCLQKLVKLMAKYDTANFDFL